MSDDLTRRQPEDPTKINLNQSWEVGYWTAMLGVPYETLVNAINAVGNKVSSVKKWLAKNGCN